MSSRRNPCPYYNNRQYDPEYHFNQPSGYYNSDQNHQRRRQYCQAKPPRSHRQKNHRRVPDRWLNYDPVGKKIENARFVAFKTPLKSTFFREGDTRFELRDSGYTLGLVIDLTNTNRYYDSRLWDEHGVEYTKLQCPGHEVNKSEHLVQEFIEVVVRFFAANHDNEKIIGIHCTHGLNRTGYLICRYLIDKLGWTAEQAIKEFEASRGHRIERDAYISSLYQAEKSRTVSVNEGGSSSSLNEDESA